MKWKNNAVVKYLSSIPEKLFVSELFSDPSNWTGCLWMMHQGSSWWQRFSIQEKRRKQWYSVHWKLAGCSMLEECWGKKQVNNCDHCKYPKLGIWDCYLEFALLLSGMQIILFLAFSHAFLSIPKKEIKELGRWGFLWQWWWHLPRSNWCCGKETTEQNEESW